MKRDGIIALHFRQDLSTVKKPWEEGKKKPADAGRNEEVEMMVSTR